MDIENNLSRQRALLDAYISQKRASKTRRRLRLLRHKTAEILEITFFQLLKELSIENFLECGAHEASASADFLKRGGKRALAVEADPSIFKLRTSKAKEFGVEIFNYGLSDKPGHMDFYIREGKKIRGSSSFLKQEGKKYRTENVELVTIDHLIETNLKTFNNLALWVDVEGFAYQVLKGGQKTLKLDQTKLLMVELENFSNWEGQHLAPEVDESLVKLGFCPIICDCQGGEQFNVIYAKRDIADQCEAIKQAAWQKMLSVDLTMMEYIFPKKPKLRDTRFG